MARKVSVSSCRVRLRGLAAAFVVALGAGCGSDELVLPNEGVAASIAVVSGDAQNGVVGAALAQPLVVRVLDSSSRPVQGQQVAFSVTSGGGSVAPASATTDASGQASATWTLGSTAGGQAAQARPTGNGAPDTLVASFTATASASGASAIAAVSGNNQTATAGSLLADSLIVRATDAAGNPVAGVAVQWTVSGGGSVSSASTVTGPDGRTGVRRTLGPGAGAQTTVATSGTLAGSPITFTSTATVGSAGSLTIERQPSASAQSGAAFPVQPQVQLRDPNGNAVNQGGTAVTATIASGPGTATLIGTFTVATNNSGLATFAGLGISGPAGTYTLNFTGLNLTGATSVSITLAAGAPARLAFGTQPSSTVAGAAISPAVTVLVQDALGNTVTSATNAVTLAIGTNPGGGTLGGTKSRAAVNGVATFNDLSINAAGSGYTLTASGVGTPVTSSSFNITTGGATTIAANSATTQSATAGAAVATPPSVKVTDASGNPVAGVAVTFAVTAGGGSVSGPSQTTNGSGIATVGSWNLGPTAGQANTLTATSPGLNGSPVTFTATAVAGSAGKLAIVTQPAATAQSGVPLAVQPVIQLQDANGNPVAIAGRSVTATIASGPGGATLSNATDATDAAGRATFTNLAISGPGGTYTLAFGGANLSSVTSTGIVVGSGAATKLGIVTAPSATAQSRVPFAQQPVIELRDASNNAVGVAGVTIVAQIFSGGGTLLGTTSRATDGQGRATFTDLAIQGTVGNRELVFASAGLASTPASDVAVTAGPADDGPSSVVVSPGSIDIGDATTVTVTLRDLDNNPVSATVAPTASPAAGSFDAASKPTNASGVATFTFTPSASGSFSIGAEVGSTTLSAVPLSVTKLATTTTIGSDNPDPSTAGGAVTVDVTVSGPGGTPTGTVTVSDGADSCIITLSGGAGSCDATLSTAGTRTLTATYSGDATYLGSSDTESHQVAAANAPPAAVGDAATVLEDAAAATIDVVSNDSDPNGDAVAILGGSVSSASNGTAAAFSSTQVSYAPAPDFNGTDAFTYQASDGSLSSSAATVTVNVTPVNDAPAFAKGADQTVSFASGPVTIPSWATAISTGPANESAQSVTFVVTTNNDAAFDVLPTVSPSGTLSFTPKDPVGVSVQVDVTIHVEDDGGTANGGADNSPAQTFLITIDP